MIAVLLLFEKGLMQPLVCDLPCQTCNNIRTDQSTCTSCENVLTLQPGGLCQLNNTVTAQVITLLTAFKFNDAVNTNWSKNTFPIVPQRLSFNSATGQCSNTNLMDIYTADDTARVYLTMPPHNNIFFKFLLINVISPYVLTINVDNKQAYQLNSTEQVYDSLTGLDSLCAFVNKSNYNRYFSFSMPHAGRNVTISFSMDYGVPTSRLSLYPPNTTWGWSIRNTLLIVTTCEICPDTEIAPDVLRILQIIGIVVGVMAASLIIVLIVNTINYSQEQPITKSMNKLNQLKNKYKDLRPQVKIKNEKKVEMREESQPQLKKETRVIGSGKVLSNMYSQAQSRRSGSKAAGPRQSQLPSSRNQERAS